MDEYRQMLKALGLPKKHGLSPRELLRRIAAAQDGQFANRQAVAIGLKTSQIHALRDRGDIGWLRQRVWRYSTAVGVADDAVSAYLACWPHGVISHASAARFHGLVRVPVPEYPIVSVPRPYTLQPAGITVHRVVALEPTDVLWVGTVRYTSLARTPCDLADPDEPWETLSILDDAVAAGASPKWIHARANALWQGRRGIAMLRDATRPGASQEFRSWLERAAAHVLAAARLPQPQWNSEVRDGRGRIGIVDALWPGQQVVCELKGLRFHCSPRQVQRDDQRLNRLLDAGYSVRTFSWHDVVQDPTAFAATVARALRAAGAAVDPDSIPPGIVVPTRPFL